MRIRHDLSRSFSLTEGVGPASSRTSHARTGSEARIRLAFGVRSGQKREMSSLWDYTAKGIDGDDVDLKHFEGCVALVVNTATY